MRRSCATLGLSSWPHEAPIRVPFGSHRAIIRDSSSTNLSMSASPLNPLPTQRDSKQVRTGKWRMFAMLFLVLGVSGLLFGGVLSERYETAGNITTASGVVLLVLGIAIFGFRALNDRH